MGKLYDSLNKHTMVPERTFYANLDLAEQVIDVPGCVVECGAWKGGMIAGISTVLGDRHYYLFDSFEGLPDAQEIDGEAALAYQRNIELPSYYNNCRTKPSYAKEAMRIVGAKNYTIIKGWFEKTIPGYLFSSDIALLRIDCDWHEPTEFCLKALYGCVAKKGIIVLDDYFAWDGCRKAVEDFFTPLGIPLQKIEKDGLCWAVKP